MATRKTIINSLPAGLTTLDLPTTTTSGEIVLFGSGDNVLAGSGVTINAQKDLTPLRSATLSTTAANPGGATTVWINSSDNKLYLGANQVGGGITLGPILSAPNANGATITGSTLNLHAAGATSGGVVTINSQRFAGEKAFMDDVYFTDSANAIYIHGEIATAMGMELYAPDYIYLNSDLIDLDGPVYPRGGVYFGGAPTAVDWTRLNSGIASGQNTITVPALTGDIVVTGGNQTIGGLKTFSGATTLQSTLTMPNVAQIMHVGLSANLLSCNSITNSVAVGAFSAAVGNDTSAFGASAGRNNVGIRNTFIGSRCGSGLSAGDTGNNNVAIGYQAFELPINATNNIAIGVNAARANTGLTTNNIIIGVNACQSSINGRANNIVIGTNGGTSLGTTSDNNIYLGNVGAAESDNIRIGTQGTQTTCRIAGISGRPSPSGVAVLCNTSGQLGTTTSSLRFKNTVANIDTTFTEKIYNMRVVSFLYNDDPTNTPQYGMIAEEVELIMPEICVYDSEEPDAPVNTIQYHILVPLMLKELQRLKARVDALEAA